MATREQTDRGKGIVYCRFSMVCSVRFVGFDLVRFRWSRFVSGSNRFPLVRFGSVGLFYSLRFSSVSVRFDLDESYGTIRATCMLFLPPYGHFFSSGGSVSLARVTHPHVP